MLGSWLRRVLEQRHAAGAAEIKLSTWRFFALNV